MDTASDTECGDEAIPLEVAELVRAYLTNLTAKARIPPELEGLPIELWLQRIVTVAVAAELRCVTPETILKNDRSLLIRLDGRKYGMRLRDALKLQSKGGRRKHA